MRKRALIYICILIWMVVAVQLVVNATMTKDDQLIEAFSVVRTIPVESDVEACGYFGDMYLSRETKEKMLVNLAKKLGITEDFSLNSVEGDVYSKSQLMKDGAFAKTDLQLISVCTQDADGKDIIEQYVYAAIKIYNSVDHILYYRDLLANTFSDIGMKADINIYLAGEIDGELDKYKKEWLVNSFLETMQAKEVCGNRTEDVYTIYGYTKNESEYLYQDNKKVNVNVAVTYDREKNKTRIHMAVPFITQSY